MLQSPVHRKLAPGLPLLAVLFFVPASARGQNLTTIATFNGTNGAGQNSNVTIDAGGNLFGTTEAGGANGKGTVWEIAQGSNTVTTLASFDSSTGTNPGGVTMDANGNLYGTAFDGGPYGYNYGTVWEIAKGSNAISVLAAFNGNGGYSPSGPTGVTIDANGNLFGTTSNGLNGSTVWEIAKGSGTVTTLAVIGTGYQMSGVTMDSQGNMFGTASYHFTPLLYPSFVWEIAKDGTFSVVSSFGTGNVPLSGVTLDAKGDLFGTTSSGQFGGASSVWEIAHGSNTITTLASFSYAGSDPYGGVALDTNGNLFGTTNYGGAGPNSGQGMVWELANGSSAITTLVSFDGTNGEYPSAGVTLDPTGNLFGTTDFGGGPYNGGTVWEFTTAVPEPSSFVTGLIGVSLTGGFVLVKRVRSRSGSSRPI